MRLLFITNNMPPLVDGVGDYTFNLAREFARHGHDVAVVCREDSRIKADYDDIKVFPVVRRWNFYGVNVVKKLLDKLDVDVVLLQYVPQGYQSKGLPFPLIHLTRMLNRRGVGLFTFFHEVYIGYCGVNIIRNVVSVCMGFIASLIMRNSTWVATSIGHYAMVMCRLAGWENGCVPLISIPSNIPECRIGMEKLAEVRSQVAQPGEFVVAFVGQRDLGSCLQAIRELLDAGRDIKVLLVGKNRLSDDNGLGDRVFRTGILPLEELWVYLNVADCVVIPEPYGSGCSFKSGSLMAALRAGKAVVTCKGFMTDGRLVDKENICFVDGWFSEGYKKCLDLLASDEDLRVRIGQNARRLVENVNWGQTYNRYIKIMQQN